MEYSTKEEGTMEAQAIRIAGTVDDSIVDGEGLRYVIFVQGCPRRCPGCHNPETQCFTGGKLTDTETLLKDILDNPLLTGVTFSGGEPFTQPEPLLTIARACHAKGLDVWSYTGYTLEELWGKHDPAIDALLKEIDVLVDGDYQEGLRDLTLLFRGSSNQRVINMKATRKQRRVVRLIDDDITVQSA